MLIDWFTVGAQLVNFLVLLWFLKRFLYRPVLDAIATRERFVTGELTDAAHRTAEAQTARDELARKSSAFDAERAGLLAKAVVDAHAERDRLMAEARHAADDAKARQDARSAALAQTRTAELARFVTAEVFAIARRAIHDLAGAGLEDRMANVLAERLQGLDPAVARLLVAPAGTPPAAIVVRSNAALSPASQALIQTAFSAASQSPERLQFEAVGGDDYGIDLRGNGQKVSWTVTDYLGDLTAHAATLAGP